MNGFRKINQMKDGNKDVLLSDKGTQTFKT